MKWLWLSLILNIFGLDFAHGTTTIQCLQGNPSNLSLQKAIMNSKAADSDGLLGHYHRMMAPKLPPIPPEKLKEMVAETCLAPKVRDSSRFLPALKKLMAEFEQIQKVARLPSISAECITASLKRSNTTMGYSCKSEKSVPNEIGAPGNKGPCVTQDMVHYLTWATNQALTCLNDPKKPLDPLLFFKKANQETGFHFFQAHDDGVGLGQLTTPALEQVSDNSRYVEKVLQSSKPECEPFKKALAKKVRNTDNWCALIEPSEGLARNLIYSIAYFLNLRDDGQLKEMTKGLEQLDIGSASYHNYGTLAAYGPKGKKTQSSILEAAKKYPKDFANFLTEAAKKVQYLAQINNTYAETLRQNNLKSDQCVR